MRIAPEHLDTLAAIVAEGTFDAAARRLSITPSAVSQRVRALEQQVGRVLVARTKPVRATAAGETLLRLGQQVSVLEREALSEFGVDADADRLTSIPIAVNADSLSTWILAPLARVSAREPVVFDLVRDDQSRTAGLLAAGTVMAAVTSDATPVAGCSSVPLGRMPYRAMATPRFAARWFPDGVDAASLDRAPLIDLDRQDELQQRFARRLAGRAVRPPRHYVPASADFAVAVRLGLGWAMLPDQHSAEALAAGQLVDLAPGRSLDVPLHWQQWQLRSRLLEAIAEEVRAEARVALVQGRVRSARAPSPS